MMKIVCHLFFSFLITLQADDIFTNIGRSRIKMRINLLGKDKIKGGYIETGKTALTSHIYRLDTMKNMNIDFSLDQLFLKETGSVEDLNDKAICSALKSKDIGVSSVASSFMLATAIFIQNKEELAKRVEYLVHMATTIHVPTVTWLPQLVTQTSFGTSSMVISLEPSMLHVTNALVDFLQTYGWTNVALVTSTSMTSYKDLGKWMDILKKERENQDHVKTFEFKVTQEIQYKGIKLMSETFHCFSFTKDFVKIMKPACIDKYATILQKIYDKDDRVIIYHSNIADLKLLLMTAKYLQNTPRGYLVKVFGKEYVWICTPALMAVMTDSFVKSKWEDQKIIADLVDKDLAFSVSGMFALLYLNDNDAYIKNAKLATQVWYSAIQSIVQKTNKTHPNDLRAITERIRPQNICNGTSKWLFGRSLYREMINVKTQLNGEYIGFNENGVINTTKLLVFNSKVILGQMDWFPVGSWTMSSKHGNLKSKIQIDGVTWPGNQNTPPSGRPPKVKLRVATLKEKPYVIYSNMEDDGTCNSNSILCRIRPGNNDSDQDSNDQVTNVTPDILLTYNATSKYIGYLNGTENMVHRCCAGLTMDILSNLMKDLNFEVDLFEVPDGKWGGWTPDGWNGLVKLLMDRKVDMVITSLKITPNRSSQIDFSVPFQVTGIGLIVVLREGMISATAFLKPYDAASWLVILVFSVHSCGAAVFIYEWLSPHGLDRGNIAQREHKFSLFRSLWLIWSMLFGAAVNADNPRGVASRFLANIWALFALVFLASYTANLAAFMIAKEDYYDLKSINDPRIQQPWSQKPPFKFSTVPSGATEETIRNNFGHIYPYMRMFNKSSVDDGISALKAGEIDAFMYDGNVLEYKVAQDDNCKLIRVGGLYAMTGYAVGFPKKSDWLEPVNERILAYQKQGLLQRWQQFWQSGACKKDRTLGKSNKTLGVKNFISAFILLLSGIFLCLIFLGLEHLFYRSIRPRLKNWDCYGCCGLVSISMGQLLSFEQSVDQTVGLVKHHKCSNPICEAHLWRNKYEMQEMAKKVQKLEATLYKKQALIDHYKNSNLRASQVAIKEAADPENIQRYLQMETQPQKSRPRQTYFEETIDETAKYVQHKHHPHCSLNQLAIMSSSDHYSCEEPVMEYSDDNVPINHGLLSSCKRGSRHSLKKSDYLNKESQNCEEIEIILPRKRGSSGKVPVLDECVDFSYTNYSLNHNAPLNPSIQRTTFYDDSESSNLTLENNQCFDKPPPYENYVPNTLSVAKQASRTGSTTANSSLHGHPSEHSSNLTLPHPSYHHQQHHYKQPAYITSPPQHSCSHQKPISTQPTVQQQKLPGITPHSHGHSSPPVQQQQKAQVNAVTVTQNSTSKSPGKKTVSCGILRTDHKSDSQSRSRNQGCSDQGTESDMVMIEKESCL